MTSWIMLVMCERVCRFIVPLRCLSSCKCLINRRYDVDNTAKAITHKDGHTDGDGEIADHIRRSPNLFQKFYNWTQNFVHDIPFWNPQHMVDHIPSWTRQLCHQRQWGIPWRSRKNQRGHSLIATVTSIGSVVYAAKIFHRMWRLTHAYN